MTTPAEEPDVTCFCAQVAEVEVDPETGEIKLNKFVSAHDVGTIHNPITHQGQIDGAVVQGFGYALMEVLLADEGQISTLSMGDVKIPTIQDIPELGDRPRRSPRRQWSLWRQDHRRAAPSSLSLPPSPTPSSTLSESGSRTCPSPRRVSLPP